MNFGTFIPENMDEHLGYIIFMEFPIREVVKHVNLEKDVHLEITSKVRCEKYRICLRGNLRDCNITLGTGFTFSTHFDCNCSIRSIKLLEKCLFLHGFMTYVEE